MNKFRLFATLLVVALCATTVFTSCGNDDDDDNNNGAFEIRATNVINSNSKISTVKFVIVAYDEVNDRDRTLTVGEAPFQNNGFTMRLIDDIPQSFLWSVENLDYIEDISDIVISDRNARILAAIDYSGGLEAYDKDGNFLGGFAFLEDIRYDDREGKREAYWAFWIFADRDVAVKGVLRNEYVDISYDLNLKKGWNTAYEYYNDGYSSSYTRKMTSQRPSAANLSWVFWE
ncbi:MAG: hypothetical protein LBI15_11525 [Dysgonamonadaceae bacterium]|jgi:hypothetical protein|nr:hypothetical protein [Dysgonamonadaceae bacterium]